MKNEESKVMEEFGGRKEEGEEEDCQENSEFRRFITREFANEVGLGGKMGKNGRFRKLLIVSDFRFLYNFGSSKAPLSTIESDAFVERKRCFR